MPQHFAVYISLELMITDPNHAENQGITPEEALFRDAERNLDIAFEQAIPLLARHGIIWLDQSYREHAYGSFHNQLKWCRILTRPWADKSGSACVVLDVCALEPMEVSWGVPLHWRVTTFSEPRILLDSAAHRYGNVKLDETISNGFEEFLFGCIEKEASRVGRKL